MNKKKMSNEYDFTKIAQEVATIENIQDCKLDYKYSSNKGDGYLGTVKAVQLLGSNKKVDVVFKYAHRDPKAHESVPLREAYLNEINFYKVIAPEFGRFQKEYNVRDPFDNTAKFYGYVNEPLNELLVLENLRCVNYDLWDRKRTINTAHLEFALRTFAKFHGTSLAMKELEPKLFNQLCKDIPSSLMRRFFEKMNLYSQVQRAIDDVLECFDGKSADTLKHFSSCIREELGRIFEFHDSDVILQGDCWCNNAMYQYEDMKDRSAPKNMKMLDFQMVAVGSPVMDLCYFFYSIAPKECIDNLDYFLKLYHGELGKHLGKFKIPNGHVFTYDRFLEHWRKVSKYGLTLSFIVRKAMLTESEDAPDLTADAEKFLDNMRIDPEKEKQYRGQMIHLIEHFINRGFI